jgi:hypothetical protein
MHYSKIAEVGADIEGRPVKLVLQEKTEDAGPPYYLVSWRTLLPQTRSNRRFYSGQDGYWSLPVPDARALLEQAAARGLLDSQYDDPFIRAGGGKPGIIVSHDLDSTQRAQLLAEITLPSEEAVWGMDPFFVVGSAPNGIWRKIMLINTSRTRVTFRSCTRDPSYRPAIKMATGSEWKLDNAMMDSSTIFMRHFLAWLKTV